MFGVMSNKANTRNKIYKAKYFYYVHKQLHNRKHLTGKESHDNNEVQFFSEQQSSSIHLNLYKADKLSKKYGV
jgi:hypothetical protein